MSQISNKSYLKFLINSGISSFLQDKPNNFYNIDLNPKNPIILNKVSDIKNIDELKFYIDNTNICNLKNNANKTVFGDGNKNAKIMLIGEAPGAEEDKIGLPFVGAAGQLLTKMLNAINLERSNIYITNVLPWRPPNNRTPSNEEILKCLPFVEKHIELINPKIIVLLGSTAAKAVLATNLNISKLRGNWYNYKSANFNKTIECLVTYHPAFLLRSPDNKRLSWEDLKLFKKRIIDENL